MKIWLRSYGGEGDLVTGYGGGEQRYTANLAHFLRDEGHEVVRGHSDHGCNSSFDLALDGAWETCSLLRAKQHAHTCFSPLHESYVNFPCYKSGKCVIITPYRRAYEASVSPLADRNVKLLLLPIAFPDNLLDSGLVPGFERKEITIVTKDWANLLFGEDHPCYYNGMRTLAALRRFSGEEDFLFNFAMAHHMPPNRGIMGLVRSFPRVNVLDQLNFFELRDLLARTKINTIIGGLSGSILDTIFTYGLPLTYSKNFFFDGCIYGLPPVETASEQDIYETVKRLWYDRAFYEQCADKWQVPFLDHRTEKLREHFSTLCSELEL